MLLHQLLLHLFTGGKDGAGRPIGSVLQVEVNPVLRKDSPFIQRPQISLVGAGADDGIGLWCSAECYGFVVQMVLKVMRYPIGKGPFPHRLGHVPKAEVNNLNTRRMGHIAIIATDDHGDLMSVLYQPVGIVDESALEATGPLQPGMNQGNVHDSHKSSRTTAYLCIMETLHSFLEQKYLQYNQSGFIPNDPVSIPHRFSKQEDIEIMGLLAATFSWGNRATILNKSSELITLMDGAPHDFVMNHREKDLARLVHFAHRTFNATDLLYFIQFLRHHYSHKASLEDAFARYTDPIDEHVGPALIGFHKYFFSLPDAPDRTRKHVPTPLRKSTCKRLNMFLRWMVRKDDCGVDFGLWTRIRPDQLVCPIDTHVNRIARELGLISRKQTNWETALELTEALRELDADDPVRFDFALFGLGIEDRKFGGLPTS